MTLVSPELGEAAVVVPRSPKEMISHSQDETTGKKLVRINSSSVQVTQECLRKARYSLRDGWRTTNESPALIAGTSIHRGAEVFYLGDIGERNLPKYADCEGLAYGHAGPDGLVGRALKAMVETAQPLAALPEGDKRSIPNLVYTLWNYFKTYIDDPYRIYVDDKGPFVERKFTHRFHEDDSLIIDIFGTIDFAFQHISDRNVIVGDHKTTSSLGWGDSSYYDRDKPNHQYTMYALGARREFGIETDDFMVNVFEIKAKPKTARGSGPSFPRQLTKRTEEDFEELREVIMKVVRDYLEAMDSDVWPMGGVDACNKYGGCPFKKVCASPKSMRETILTNQFTRGGK